MPNLNAQAEQMLASFDADETPVVEQQAPVEAQNEVQAENVQAEEGPALEKVAPEDPIKSNEEMLAEIAKINNNQEQPAEGESTEEAFNAEQFLDEFYDNPALAVEKAANIIADKKIKEVVSGIENKLKPLLDQSEAAQLKDDIKTTIGEFLNDTEDAKDLFPDIAQYIKDNNLDPKDKRSYTDAYRESKLAKQGREIEQLRTNQGKTLTDYMQDPASLEEMANNPAVKRIAVENYLKELQNGAKPSTIGVGGTVQPVAQPVNSPKTIREAGAMLREQLGK